MNFTTPVIKMKTKLNNNEVYIKRDDLLPFSFGGNKVRIAYEYYKDMLGKNKNCMIAYGSTSSNLCRILTNICASNNIPCHTIVPCDIDGQYPKSINIELCKMCDANIHYCKRENVADTVEIVYNECVSSGYSPYYINGDKYGKGNEDVPIRAYLNASEELKQQFHDMNIEFDYIVLPVGQATTLAGLLLGLKTTDTKFIGISIARKKEQVISSLTEYIGKYGENIDLINKKVEIFDEYMFGGYGKYNSEILTKIKDVYKTDGIITDPTYSGKALLGADYVISNKNITNSKILFLHTGGGYDIF